MTCRQPQSIPTSPASSTLSSSTVNYIVDPSSPGDSDVMDSEISDWLVSSAPGIGHTAVEVQDVEQIPIGADISDQLTAL